MAKEKGKKDNETLAAPESNKFKAIQDILMGGEMRQIEQRFHKLQNRFDESREELESLLKETKETLQAEQAKTNKELSEKLDKLIEKLTEKVDRNHKYAKEEISRIDFEKTNRKELGKMFLMIGEALAKDEE
jgi:F0F1-type ATP synthase membrane subunit b/b'